MKQPDLAETTATDSLEQRVQAVEQGLAVFCKNVGEAMAALRTAAS